MARALLFDTDVLIDCLRGYPQAITWLAQQRAKRLIAAMTVAELYAGMRDNGERVKLKAFLTPFQVVSMDGEIAEHAGLYRRDYGKSHGTGIADAAIAATAEAVNAALVTLNTRHFPMLRNVVQPYRKA